MRSRRGFAAPQDIFKRQRAAAMPTEELVILTAVFGIFL